MSAPAIQAGDIPEDYRGPLSYLRATLRGEGRRNRPVDMTDAVQGVLASGIGYASLQAGNFPGNTCLIARQLRWGRMGCVALGVRSVGQGIGLGLDDIQNKF